jgi:Type III restriction enzyme, res subunit
MGRLSELRFRHPFRKYQRQILERVEVSGAAERKHHIVAPPGSGKTIVGLELIRRFGEPAVVFAPTATIQQQWCEEVGLFTGGPTGGLVSREPGRFAPINVYTYQLISAPGESRELLRETARRMWLEELLKREGATEGDANSRLETMRRNNPDAYGKELGRREESYDLWRVGEGYENSSRWSASLDVRNLEIRTAYTLQESLAAVVRKLRVSAILVLLSLLFGVIILLGGIVPGIIGIPLILGATAVFFFNLRSAYLLGKSLLVEQRPDAILRDAGHALLLALQDADLIDKDVAPDSVRVAEKSEGYEVSLEDASTEDAAVFVRSYRQIFAPVRDQRYLILRDENRLPNRTLRYMWVLFRPFFGRFEDYPPAYHPVPDLLATRRENAEAFSRHWQRYVGGGTFVYTRSAEGRRTLLIARAQRRPETKDLAFEVWK